MGFTWGLLGKHVILPLDSLLTDETEPVCQFIKGIEKILSNKALCVFYEPPSTRMQQNTNDLQHYQFFWGFCTDIRLKMDCGKSDVSALLFVYVGILKASVASAANRTPAGKNLRYNQQR